jgi:hypothetical protein
MNQSGNIGIGTTTPAGVLHVKSNSTDFLMANATLDIGSGAATGGWARGVRILNSIGSDGTDGVAFGAKGSGTTASYAFMSFPTTASGILGYNSDKILILNNLGNVGIGTTTPDQKLAVNGTIHSKAVLVDLNGWSDFVFNTDYRLPSLPEVKSYIDKNHHLPNVPSATDVEKNGLNLGDMNKVLLQKVEELTLYLIEKDKQLKEQEKTNLAVKQRLDDLTEQLKAVKPLKKSQ